jgi:hypothetical protein
MKKIQDRVMAAIEAIASTAGCEAAASFDYSNTGQIVFYEIGQDGPTLRPRGAMRFSFQTGYVTFSRPGGEPGRMLQYDDENFEAKLQHTTWRYLRPW